MSSVITVSPSNLFSFFSPQTIANLVRFEGWLVQDIVNAILDGTEEHLFMELSVADLMWGYEDNLLKTIKEAAAKIGFKLPFDDKFGLFYEVSELLIA